MSLLGAFAAKNGAARRRRGARAGLCCKDHARCAGAAAGSGQSGSAKAGACTAEEAWALRKRIANLSARLMTSETALLRSEEALGVAQAQSAKWAHCMKDLFHGLLLNPRMNAKCAPPLPLHPSLRIG